MSLPRVVDEVVDTGSQNFHHASLAAMDDEWQATEDITQIVPYVFIGSWDNSVDLDLLRNKNIKFSLNVTEMKKEKSTEAHMSRLGIVHEHLSLENLPDARLVQILQSAYAFIKRAVDLKRNVLVYCHQGLSTSAAVVSYYILKNFYNATRPAKNMLPVVVKTIHQKRGFLDINFGFLEQLEDIEAELSGRPVDPDASLSIRRNKKLKERKNRLMMETVNSDRVEANAKWKTTHKHRY